ncbi:unnamed protein product [Oppiella nova]|uniref:Uncharacterized protein n=1 Tax=Oppiella nova TaxID=334625 RepID=A0A7R9M3G1_9ACAR|nr:unnamed protein product [Oppiella nova]CAG2169942.1 unnamed protein product [Oppiella nova]
MKYSQFINGWNFVLAVNTDNNVIFSFGKNNRGGLERHVDMDENVFGWGCNDSGQVGCGNKSIQLDPTPVEFSTEYQISKIECNSNTSLALTCEGKVFIWGEVETHDKMNNSISFEKSFDVINKLGEGGYGQD